MIEQTVSPVNECEHWADSCTQGLVGNQYSTVSSSGFWAQLALCVGPTAFFIVRVPTNVLMSVCTFCEQFLCYLAPLTQAEGWGIAMIGLAFSRRCATLFSPTALLIIL